VTAAAAAADRTAPVLGKSTLIAGCHRVCFLRLSFNLQDVGSGRLVALLDRLIGARGLPVDDQIDLTD